MTWTYFLVKTESYNVSKAYLILRKCFRMCLMQMCDLESVLDIINCDLESVLDIGMSPK